MSANFLDVPSLIMSAIQYTSLFQTKHEIQSIKKVRFKHKKADFVVHLSS